MSVRKNRKEKRKTLKSTLDFSIKAQHKNRALLVQTDNKCMKLVTIFINTKQKDKKGISGKQLFQLPTPQLQPGILTAFTLLIV